MDDIEPEVNGTELILIFIILVMWVSSMNIYDKPIQETISVLECE